MIDCHELVAGVQLQRGRLEGRTETEPVRKIFVPVSGRPRSGGCPALGDRVQRLEGHPEPRTRSREGQDERRHQQGRRCQRKVLLGAVFRQVREDHRLLKPSSGEQSVEEKYFNNNRDSFKKVNVECESY